MLSLHVFVYFILCSLLSRAYRAYFYISLASATDTLDAELALSAALGIACVIEDALCVGRFTCIPHDLVVVLLVVEKVESHFNGSESVRDGLAINRVGEGRADVVSLGLGETRLKNFVHCEIGGLHAAFPTHVVQFIDGEVFLLALDGALVAAGLVVAFADRQETVHGVEKLGRDLLSLLGNAHIVMLAATRVCLGVGEVSPDSGAPVSLATVQAVKIAVVRTVIKHAIHLRLTASLDAATVTSPAEVEVELISILSVSGNALPRDLGITRLGQRVRSAVMRVGPSIRVDPGLDLSGDSCATVTEGNRHVALGVG